MASFSANELSNIALGTATAPTKSPMKNVTPEINLLELLDKHSTCFPLTKKELDGE